MARRSLLKAAALLLAPMPPGAASATSDAAHLVLRRGLNTWPWFSLTREYPAPRTDYAWPPFQEQRPVPTRTDLERLREAGFDFIRIPVDPGPFLALPPAQKAALVAKLGEAVRLSVDVGLKVVVNIQANGATHYYSPLRMLAQADAPLFRSYLGFVGEVAELLGRFPQGRVALEPVNEPQQACASTVWFDMQRWLFETARRTAPALTLVATGGCGSMVPGLMALDPLSLKAFEPLIFTFHFYEPYLFSHQGAPWMREPVYRALNAVPWPASAGSLDATLKAVRARMETDTALPASAKDAAYAETEKVLKVYFDADPGRPFVDHYLDMIADWGRGNGVDAGRILMGEFGALRSDARYVAAGAADRARYVRDVRESAEARGFGWAFWNMFDGMGIVDDATRVFDPAMIESLGLTLPAGAREAGSASP